MCAVRLIPPLLWTALIAWFSTDAWSGEETASLLAPWISALLPGVGADALATAHWISRKLAHFAEYGVLAALWAWAVPGWRWPLALALLTAALDELHQATTVARSGSPIDVLIDASGIALGLVAVRRAAAPAVEAATGLLLWTAALGGGLALLLALWTGAPGGWLWITTPAAAAALWWRRRTLGEGLRPPAAPPPEDRAS